MTTRRRFLALAVLAVGSTAGLVARGVGRLRPSVAVARDLARLAGDPDTAQAVGRLYLDAPDGAADAARGFAGLADVVVGNLTGARLASPDRLRALVAEQVRRDWTRGQTVVIDGWVLSRTEVRLCALAALSSVEAGDAA